MEYMGEGGGVHDTLGVLGLHLRGRGRVGVGEGKSMEGYPTPYLPTPYPLSPIANPSSEKKWNPGSWISIIYQEFLTNLKLELQL